jgi:hypothetical protein
MSKDNIKPRNYVNQAIWEKNHYRRYVVCLTDKDNLKLEKILQNRNIGFTEWVKLKIKTDRIK